MGRTSRAARYGRYESALFLVSQGRRFNDAGSVIPGSLEESSINIDG